MTRDRAEIGAGIFGMIALLTPLMLWVAWSKTMMKAVLVVGLGSLLIAMWFVRFWPEKPGSARGEPPAA